jgi:AraC-like DNA-binding protein
VYRWVIDIFWEYAVSVYLVFTIITILRHRRRITRFFSSRRQKELNWLLYLSGGFLAYILISLALIYLSSFGIFPRMPFLGILSVFMLLLFLLGVGVFGYQQKGIFSTDALEEISNLQFQGHLPAHPEREFKYRKSGLQDDESDRILQSLKRLMKTDKLYLDPELTLQDLASGLSTTIHKLSQVINEQFGQNFYDYINTQRVEEVKKRLQDSRYNHLKVIAIAYDCGFNSKSAFYNAFRKATAMTPVEYRNKYQPEHGVVFSN